MSILSRFLLAVAVLVTSSNAFTTTPSLTSTKLSTSFHFEAQQHFQSNLRDQSSTLLSMANKDGENFMANPENRGLLLMGFILFLNLWVFSIPPEFRRQPICSQETYEFNQIYNPNNDCVTIDVWKDSIAEYYANGGGVQFDFSINPKTLEANQAKLDSFLGKY